MSGKPEDYGQLVPLIAGLLDGRLIPEERARLELLLESDPAARRVYFQMVDQEIELECLLVPDRTATLLQFSNAVAPPVPAAARRGSWWPSLAIAALAALLVTLWWRWAAWLPSEPVGEMAKSTPAARSPATANAAGDPWAWVEDFESGAAPGWIGEIVSAGLPAGSRHGIRAVRHASVDGVFYQIAPPADWADGIAALTSRSTLHVTYRLGVPAWVNVFMHALPANGDGTQPSMFQVMGSAFPGAAGQWQTASIPFSLFQRKVLDPAQGGLAFTGGGPRDGERVASLIFSAPHAIDLTIDRIWITKGGTGVETVTPEL